MIFAQALCQGARCLLLDEPTAGLDPAHARAVFARLRERCDAGDAAVVVTHDLDLALRYGGVMWLVASGALAAGRSRRRARFDGDPRGVPARDPFGTLPSGRAFAVPA